MAAEEIGEKYETDSHSTRLRLGKLLEIIGMLRCSASVRSKLNVSYKLGYTNP